jgi:acetyltransferase
VDHTIVSLGPDEAHACQADLVAVPRDAVADGASVGFLPPLSAAEAADYWRSVADALAAGGRVLPVARAPGGTIVGTVQLDLERQADGRHRAEVAKLLVHRAARRRGIARALMRALEGEALARGRTTLVLDTRQGDPAERLYRALGYRLAGIVPAYALGADGALHPTAIYYRLPDRLPDA